MTKVLQARTASVKFCKFCSPAADRRSVSAPVEAVASLEADLDALRRDVASLRPRQQASPPLWLFFAAVGLALTAWIMTPEDPYAAALAS